MGNLAFAIRPQEMDSAIRRARARLRLLEEKPCISRRERKWPIPEQVQLAMLEAMHPEMGVNRIRRLFEEERISLPQKKYHLRKVREAAILSFAEYMGRAGKKPAEIGDGDFSRNGLGWLANRYGSSFEALKSAWLLSEKDRHAHRFRTKPWTFGNRENRIRALREAEAQLGGRPRDTRLRDLKEPFPKVYAMVINYYNGSVFEAYLDAGLVKGKDEELMRANNKPGK
jgi:hypothetical protein